MSKQRISYSQQADQSSVERVGISWKSFIQEKKQYHTQLEQPIQTKQVKDQQNTTAKISTLTKFSRHRTNIQATASLK